MPLIALIFPILALFPQPELLCFSLLSNQKFYRLAEKQKFKTAQVAMNIRRLDRLIRKTLIDPIKNRPRLVGCRLVGYFSLILFS